MDKKDNETEKIRSTSITNNRKQFLGIMKNMFKLTMDASNMEGNENKKNVNKRSNSNFSNYLNKRSSSQNNFQRKFKEAKPEKKENVESEEMKKIKSYLKESIDDFVARKTDADSIKKCLQRKKKELITTFNEIQVEIKQHQYLQQLEEAKAEIQINKYCNEYQDIIEKLNLTKVEKGSLKCQKQKHEEIFNILIFQNHEKKNDLEKSINKYNLLKLKLISTKKTLDIFNQLNEKKVQKRLLALEMSKNLHNEYLELKGNIRVFCRVKPILPKEAKDDTNIEKYIEFVDIKTMIIYGPTTKSNIGKYAYNQNKDVFCFDRIFTPENKQNDVFGEISQLVQSALNGYKVCIFAYGQTGSGKTYTMEGEGYENRGIIPRSLEKIFDIKKKMENLGWNISLEASCLEIYIDQARDLLSKNSNNVIISNYNKGELTKININQMEEFQEVLSIAANKRAVAETMCNERSSRSHFILQVRIGAINEEKNLTRKSALNLIDLAGSERISKSKVEDERLKETVSINKSLSALKGVITALINNANNKNNHIPYRDSTLTMFLQEFLGGDSKTLMLVNISPLISNYSETINSLKFATDVNSCVLKSNDE